MPRRLSRTAKRIFLAAWERSCATQEKLETRGRLNWTRRLRIAIVKSSLYTDLYSRAYGSSPKDIILSSNFRSGPVGLFADHDTDFILIRPESDANLTIQREKVSRGYDAPHHAAIRKRQLAEAVNGHSVDWTKYDLVIALDAALAPETTRHSICTLWATMIEDHSLSAFREFSHHAPPGYDLFFNQHFGPTPRTLFRRSHVIEYPYTYSTSGCIERLFGPIVKEQLVLLESSQIVTPTLQNISVGGAQLLCSGGSTLSDHLKKLCRAKVFLAPQFQLPRWGNGLIEAAAAECVLIARRRTFWNPCLILKDNDCSDDRSAVTMAQTVLNDRPLYRLLVNNQNTLLEWFVADRPFVQILEAVGRISRDLSVRSVVRAGS